MEVFLKAPELKAQLRTSWKRCHHFLEAFCLQQKVPVVRSPYDLILEDGLVVVATTKKRICAYLQGVPGKDSTLGMLKGGRGENCAASILGTVRRMRGDAKLRLERLHWFWGRWLFNVVCTMQAHTVCLKQICERTVSRGRPFL